MPEFQFKQFTFAVKLVDGKPAYRDKRHLGGPWSDAERDSENRSLDATFRRRLRAAIGKLQTQS